MQPEISDEEFCKLIGPFDPDKKYTCPVCLMQIATDEEKTAHLQNVHGYETLVIGEKVPEIWIHCDCGVPMYKFVGKELPVTGTLLHSQDFEGAIKGERIKKCPKCGSSLYMKTRNIHGLKDA